MRGLARQSNTAGFSLTELLAVVAIIVLLTAIVVPNVVAARTKAAVTTTEVSIENLKTSLEMYRRAFGTYPGDVFPSEDVNNDGVLATAEDIGVDVDIDGTPDYAIAANGRIDAGDGLVNILDLEWALRTSARGGPFIDEIPEDGWGQQFVYLGPLTRSLTNTDFLYVNPIAAVIRSEDFNRNGRLDATEDTGIAIYVTTNTDTDAGFPGGKRMGRDNGILDYGDDDNQDGLVTFGYSGTDVEDQWELGNQDASPDGLARNRGFYLYSVGIDGVDSTQTGYEDITGDLLLTAPLASTTIRNDLGANGEDLNTSTDLDTGYEDTGVDGRPHSKDADEDNGQLDAGFLEEYLNFDGISSSGVALAGIVDSYHSDNGLATPLLDIGGDDINSWNANKTWRNHANYN